MRGQEMENQSNIPSSDMNQEMGFVKEEEYNHSKNFPAASLVGGGSWWWQSVKPFVHGGLAGATYYALSWGSFQFIELPLLRILGDEFKESAKIREDLGRLAKSRTSYGGLPAQVLAVTLYRALAFGSYDVLTRKATAHNKGIPLSMYQEACCGILAGVAEACIASPLRYAALCVQADRNKPTAQRLNYRNAFDAAYRISVNQGISALWRGGLPYAKTVVAFDMGMLASYNRSFNYFWASRGYNETIATLGAGAVSSFFGIACCRPFVVIQDYMLHAKPGSDGKPPFTSSFDCALKILKVRGLREFYHGFSLHLTRVTPAVMFTWLVLEDIRKEKGFA
ncbi:hypothetical protein HS088_TW22G00877 [Tripterygium wilfordii]|uniref:Mitochondrial substrate carrier family protein n=1 Tax=Tripterygium wilfordii TaxID=458696 RepID=A0A7J7BZ64_TRIWF|nr:mitochondrial dicarboxylate/tricarboxylate transporter DTC-like [Tripterygium wilfordii]KAF5727189.1 hypothetical protein HS088_TW22G00877 [Tripterygium wilfordii]